MEILTIAFRNILRNPRRTALNLVAIAIGVMIALNLLGWIRGFVQTTFQSQMDLDTGHVQILNKGYQSESQRLPLDFRIDDWPQVKKTVEALPGVVAVSARIDYHAEITNGETGIRVFVRGVDPEGEATTTTLKNNVVEGTWIAETNQIVIGKGLAKKLNLHVGDQVYMNALDQFGVKNLVDGKIAGIFSLGYQLFDDSLVLTSLVQAQETLALPSTAATRVVVRFRDATQTAQETELVQKAIAGESTLRAYEWREFSQTIVTSIESRVRIMFVMFFILIVLVVIGIFNSMSMAVQERFREIGTLRAIGMNRRTLVRMFLFEGSALGLLGGAIGVAAGGVLGYVFFVVGFDPRGVLPADLPIPFTTVMRPLFTLWDFVFALALATAIAIVGSLSPSLRAGRMIVRDALGSHV